MSSTVDNRRGIFALTASMAAYAVSDVCTKLVAKTHPFGEVIAVRGFFTIVVVGIVLGLSGSWRFVPRTLTKPVLLRSALDALASATYIAALINMPIANAAALNMAHPLILTVLSVIVFAEIVGWRRWSAIVVGFIGVLFIVKPTPAAFDVFALFGLAAPIFGACRELITRRLNPALPTMAVTFISMCALTLAGCAVGISEAWHGMGVRELGYLAFAAVFFSLATYLVVLAFRASEISAVAPFRYTFLVWAGLAGYLAFNEVPDHWSIAGAALIVGSGLYALHREAVRRRAAMLTTKG